MSNISQIRKEGDGIEFLAQVTSHEVQARKLDQIRILDREGLLGWSKLLSSSGFLGLRRLPFPGEQEALMKRASQLGMLKQQS